jgi:rhamnose transport system ATP-binding protein
MADDVTVLRDGQVVRSGPCANETEKSLIEAMLGRSLDATFPPKPAAPKGSPVVLSIKGLSAPGVKEASLEVHAGEIVGLAGLVGAGRTELAQAVVGWRRSQAGNVELTGGPVGHRTPRAMLRRGLAIIPESRKEQGLLLGRSVAENAVLSSLEDISVLGYVRRRVERRVAADVLAKVDVRATSQDMAAGALSGGNQQKLLFARALLCGPKVLIADEPTRGVDIGARRAIYDLLVSLTGDGLGMLLISSDVEEILGLSHRVLVMRSGRVVAELDGTTATEHDVLEAAFREATGAAR